MASTAILIDYPNPQYNSKIGDVAESRTEIIPQTKIQGNVNQRSCRINFSEGSYFAVCIMGTIEKEGEEGGKILSYYDQLAIYKVQNGASPQNGSTIAQNLGHFPFKNRLPRTNCIPVWEGNNHSCDLYPLCDELKASNLDHWRAVVEKHPLENKVRRHEAHKQETDAIEARFYERYGPLNKPFQFSEYVELQLKVQTLTQDEKLLPWWEAMEYFLSNNLNLWDYFDKSRFSN